MIQRGTAADIRAISNAEPLGVCANEPGYVITRFCILVKFNYLGKLETDLTSCIVNLAGNPGELLSTTTSIQVLGDI